ncbi:MAG: hypothetical protein ACRCYZ_02445 [Alphaproteobacteria bacterium]
MAGQTSVSMEVVDKISKEIVEDINKKTPLEKQKKKGRIRGFFLENNKPVFCFNSGTSPLRESLRVIKTLSIGGLRPYVLSDGHHTLASSVKAIKDLGGDLSKMTIPVIVDEKFAGKYQTKEDLLLAAEKENKIYAKGGSLPVMGIEEVPDGQMRSFIEQTEAKCSESKDYTGPATPLWLLVSGKTNYRDKDFIEFYIEEILEKGNRLGNITYQKGDKISPEKVESASKFLLQNPSFLKKHGIRVIYPAKTGKLKGTPVVFGTGGMTPEEFCKGLKDPGSLKALIDENIKNRRELAD